MNDGILKKRINLQKKNQFKIPTIKRREISVFFVIPKIKFFFLISSEKTFNISNFSYTDIFPLFICWNF